MEKECNHDWVPKDKIDFPYTPLICTKCGVEDRAKIKAQDPSLYARKIVEKESKGPSQWIKDPQGQPEKIRVRIEKCSKPTYWYHNAVGMKFYVEEQKEPRNNDFWKVVDDELPVGWAILKSDCTIVTPTSEKPDQLLQSFIEDGIVEGEPLKEQPQAEIPEGIFKQINDEATSSYARSERKLFVEAAEYGYSIAAQTIQELKEENLQLTNVNQDLNLRLEVALTGRGNFENQLQENDAKIKEQSQTIEAQKAEILAIQRIARQGIFPHLPVETMGAQKCIEIDKRIDAIFNNKNNK